ncbi:hypothetical protein D9619_009694 [Psilocybe cf. subviscida]|uniref:Uncharacterized protein n=1 Tax=Psilocybe cf. subviscida TaxID=2480587 RepID=A0A8H5BMR0_9AGAR|nr:hypothetical protein D9619_009694 [Psilocybe cf. subviscida]
MSPKGKKHSPRAEATRKRKRDARRQTRQSISPSQSPSKRGRDAQSEPSPTKGAEASVDGILRVIGEPNTPEYADSPETPVTPSSKTSLATKTEDITEAYTICAGASPKLSHHTKSSATNSSAEQPNFAAVLSRPGVVHILGDSAKTDQAKAKKKVTRPGHGLVLHIPAVSPSWDVSIDDTEATSSPLSKGSPSPSKNSVVRTPTRSPRKLTFGVGFGSSSGMLSELPFYMDSPGKRYDDRLGQALASSPTLGSMGPPDTSPTFGSRSPYAFGTPKSPTLDRVGSPSTDPGVRRRTHSQLLDSPSARAITDAIGQRDSESDGTSWVRAGNHGRPPRAALGTLYEKPATRFPGAGSVLGGPSSRPAAFPERKLLAEGYDGKADSAALVPVSIDEFLKSYEKGSPGKGEIAGSSRNMSSRTAGDSDLHVQPGDGSPKLRTRRPVPLAPLDICPLQTLNPGSDDEESDLELSDKENM